LNINDELGPGQALSQLVVVPLEFAHRLAERIVFGLGAATMRRQASVSITAHSLSPAKGHPTHEMKRCSVKRKSGVKG